MKNRINILKTFGFIALFSFLFVPVTLLAEETKPVLPVDITYVGNIDYSPVFQISFDNQEGSEVNLILRDEDGNIIFSEVVKDKKYARKIQLQGLDRDVKLTLTLRSKKSTQSQVFQINKNTRIVEDVVVAKVQ